MSDNLLAFPREPKVPSEDGPPSPAYAELAVTSNFSFLNGASRPEELVITAALYSMAAVGIADRNTLAGVVRAFTALDHPDLPPKKPKLLVGARLVFTDGTPDIVAYPQDRAAYGRLCRLLSDGKLRAKKGECHLTMLDLVAYADGQLLIVMPPRRFHANAVRRTLDTLSGVRRGAVWLGASMLYGGDDRRRLARLAALADDAQVPLIATNDVLYHDPARRPLQDVVTCIREHLTIESAGRRLEMNAERHMKPPDEMARLFHEAPEALAETVRLAARVGFSLDQLKYSYPDEPVPPGSTPQQHLEHLTWAGAAEKYPEGLDDKVRATLVKELALIAELDIAPYFLTVHDIVRFARSKDILCQGRGSAANSAVCYVLGVTAVDPTKVDLLFDRFISTERREPPDIDVDFEHERREEVIQYVYARYGRHRAGIAATVITYRPRSAIREVGKALGLTEDVTAALARTVWGGEEDDVPDRHVRQAGLDPDNPVIRRAVALAEELMGFPRHLSQHVGGFVLTRDRLDEMVPVGNAAMDDRTFIEWDKDDIDALRMMKVDVLALGMLTCIRKAFDLIARHGGPRLTLADVMLTEDEPSGRAVYAMLSEGDSLGVFQVESRAQMNMLPRLRPQNFYDLVIEVAIVRPGPIQGDMVHPYLRRRQKLDDVAYPSPSPEHGPADELVGVLGRTLGVPLFQEQAMSLAMVAAKFTPEEANRLRRAMATFRHVGTIHTFRDKLVDGMVVRGYARDFAERCFKQIEGFGNYGFPESHAASFAGLVYVSSWIKCHHPAAFACALLNAQPMGFYAPAQIVRDAREHGVTVLPVDVNVSQWDNTLEVVASSHTAPTLSHRERVPPKAAGEGREPQEIVTPHPTARAATFSPWEKERAHPRAEETLALRLGFRQVGSLSEDALKPLVARRQDGYGDLEALARRSGLAKRHLLVLADADALRSLGLSRRDGLWAVRRLPDDKPLPLFAAADANELGADAAVALPLMARSEEVVADYQTLRLSLKGHPVEFLRARLARERVLACRDVADVKDGSFVRAAGVVLVRQRPGSASGVIFMTLEDETGIVNVVVWPAVMKRYRREVMGSRLIVIEGRIQKSPEGVVHLVAQRLIDRTRDLALLSTHPSDFAVPQSRADEVRHPGHDQREDARPHHRHPRDVRILPKSRDFH